MSKKILIAPWGNPSRWSSVKYKWNNKEEEITSKTSVLTLINYLNPEKVLILVGDSLIDAENLSEKSYEEVKKSVTKMIEEFLKSPDVELDKYSEVKVKICILPSVGKFPNGSFEGQLLDYYYALLYKLAEEFLEEDYEEIYLDLTHGINFMPVLTYRALREVLQVLAFFSKKRLCVYNADPYAGKGNEILYLHQVEDTEIEADIPDIPSFYKESFSPKLVQAEKRSSPAPKQEFIRKIVAFLGAIFFGLPLAIFTFFPDIEEIRKYLQDALKTWEENVEVKEEGKKVLVKRKGKFTKIVQALIPALLLGEELKRRKLILKQEEEVKFENLKQLCDKFLYNNRRIKSITGKEMENLKNILAGEEWKSYAEILGKEYKDNIDPRHFLAHAGFEYNAVEVKEKNGGLMLRYRKNKISNIISFILNNF